MLSLSKTQKDLLRYLALLSLLFGYFGYMSYKYGLAEGGWSAALTWSFFVLCTPIADAGFLLDFPVRLLTNLKMIFSEMMVWALAGIINASAMEFSPGSYDQTAITRLLKQVLLNPWPYWSIIGLCALGTFLSVFFGDSLFDAIKKHAKGDDDDPGAKKKRRIQMGAMIGVFMLIFAVYYHLIQTLGIEKIIEGG